MNADQILAEIREANLSYLMLAQSLIRSDREQALYRLGISEDTASLIGRLTSAQMMKFARSNTLLCRFRMDDDLVWGLLTRTQRREFVSLHFVALAMGLSTLIVMVGGNWRYGVISALLGFALGTVGVDLETGQTRFTFRSAELIGGIDFIPIAIGLFGLGELYYAFYTGMHVSGTGGIVQYQKEKRFWPEVRDYVETKFSLLRGSVLGFVIGVIPGAGATIASLMSYSLEKSLSRTPEKFGKGAMAGLVGPEAANNAASSGAMVPLLTLGIPGSASTAVLLAAFVLWGLTPGPLLMGQKPEFAWGLIASMYLGNVALLALNIFAIPLFVQMVKLPYRILAPAVILVCTAGTYSVNGSIVETWLMFAAGLVGFFMKRHGFSPAALVLALVLGPLAEQSLRQSLTISRGSFGIFLERPMSLWILGITAVVLALGLLMRRSSRPD